MIAGLGLGYFSGPEDALKTLHKEREFLPIPENVVLSDRSYNLYRELYPSLYHVYQTGAAH